MKYLKLYESFNFINESFNTGDVIEDIKRIAYILEDDGYTIGFITKEDVIRRNKFLDMFDEPGFEIKITIRMESRSESSIKKFREDTNRFLSILKDYLDYVPNSDIELLPINIYFPNICKITIK